MQNKYYWGVASTFNYLAYIHESTGDFKNALDLYTKTYNIYKSLDSKLDIATLSLSLALCQFKLNEVSPHTESLISYAIQEFSTNKDVGCKHIAYADAINTYATYKYLIGDFESTYNYAIKAIDIYKQQNQTDSDAYLQTLMNISLSANATGRWEDASKFSKEAKIICDKWQYRNTDFAQILQLYDKFNPDKLAPQQLIQNETTALELIKHSYGINNDLYIQSLISIGDQYVILQNFNSAKKAYTDAEKIISQFSAPNPFLQATIYNSLGNLALLDSDFILSEKHFTKSKTLLEHNNATTEQIYLQTLSFLASSYFACEKYQDAYRTCSNAQELATKFNIKGSLLSSILTTASKCCDALGNYQLANDLIIEAWKYADNKLKDQAYYELLLWETKFNIIKSNLDLALKNINEIIDYINRTNKLTFFLPSIKRCLVYIYVKKNEYNKALDLCTQILDESIQNFGIDHLETTGIQAEIAIIHSLNGQIRKAYDIMSSCNSKINKFFHMIQTQKPNLLPDCRG